MLGPAGPAGPAAAQDNGAQKPSARQQIRHIHRPQSIGQELARLTKDLELTPNSRIHALLDKDPTASRHDNCADCISIGYSPYVRREIPEMIAFDPFDLIDLRGPVTTG